GGAAWAPSFSLSPRRAPLALERGAVRHLDADVGEREARDRARDAADDGVLVVLLGILPRGLSVELERAEGAVDVPAVAQPGERLLARVAALRERDGSLVEP